jgi:hypothetical protein
MLLMFRNDTGFGGNNGMTGFTTLLGMQMGAPSTADLACDRLRPRSRSRPSCSAGGSCARPSGGC